MLQKSAVVYYLKRKVRQRLKADINIVCFIFNQAVFVINFHFIAIVDFFKRIRLFNNIKAIVNGIAIEDSGEGFCNNRLDLYAANGPDRMLSG